MSREEFLKGLEEALAGEVPEAVIRDNVGYYRTYISQEMEKGRTMNEIINEIGDPRITARTIIDSYEGAEGVGREDGSGAYRDPSYRSTASRSPVDGRVHYRYIDLNKWYWKLLLSAVGFLILFLVINIIGGIVSIVLSLAGPILLILFLVWFFKSLRR